MNARDMVSSLPALETREIPTLIFGARTHLPHATALIIQLGDDPQACRAWLRGIKAEISYGHERTDHATVLGFTATGLRKLGLPDEDIAVFPLAFQSGMTGPGRDRVLGDVGANASSAWGWGEQDDAAKRCDAILVLYAEKADAITSKHHPRHTTALANAGAVVGKPIILPERARTLVARDKPGRGYTTEPFGFADGISQPVIRGTPRAKGVPPQDISPAGAFILGYEALATGTPSLSPLIPRNRDPNAILPIVTGDDGITRADLGRNGSFVVVRQLEQDVDGFRKFANEEAEIFKHFPAGFTNALKPEWIAAKMVGRWKNGAPLVGNPDRPGASPDNDFLYRAEDPYGLACPLGAHIRRANPRDSLTGDPSVSLEITSRHRLLRVGRPYMPEAGKNPGILFMCVNADIESQFETVQQSWINRTDFHGLRNESDPLTGITPAGGGGTYTIPTETGPACLKNIPDFVKVIGGGYFFMPSRAAICYLAERGAPAM